MNNNNDVFWGSKKDWLDTKEYMVTDISDDQFAVEFQKISIKEKIAQGENILEAGRFIADNLFQEE